MSFVDWFWAAVAAAMGWAAAPFIFVAGVLLLLLLLAGVLFAVAWVAHVFRSAKAFCKRVLRIQ